MVSAMETVDVRDIRQGNGDSCASSPRIPSWVQFARESGHRRPPSKSAVAGVLGRAIMVVAVPSPAPSLPPPARAPCKADSHGQLVRNAAYRSTWQRGRGGTSLSQGSRRSSAAAARRSRSAAAAAARASADFARSSSTRLSAVTRATTSCSARVTAALARPHTMVIFVVRSAAHSAERNFDIFEDRSHINQNT